VVIAAGAVAFCALYAKTAVWTLLASVLQVDDSLQCHSPEREDDDCGQIAHDDNDDQEFNQREPPIAPSPADRCR
jgi:hypothetical protein